MDDKYKLILALGGLIAAAAFAAENRKKRQDTGGGLSKKEYIKKHSDGTHLSDSEKAAEWEEMQPEKEIKKKSMRWFYSNLSHRRYMIFKY